MSLETDIYDYETAIGNAISTVLRNVDLTTLSILSQPEFQKERPRCEVFAEMGGSKGKLYVGQGTGNVPGTTHELLRTGRCKIWVITPVDQALHSEYRARIRNVCATMNTRVNAILQYHEMQWFSDAGVEQYGVSDDEGSRLTVLAYDFEVFTIPAAITTLTSQ